jgi:hypothetical protein
MAARRRLSESEIVTIVRERPYVLQVLQTQILYDIAGMLDEAVERILNVERLLAKPKGYIHPIKVAVDKITLIDFVRGEPYTPLFSISLFNDGPDEVYPSINAYQKGTSLKVGESLSIDMHSPVIEKLYLDVDKGKRAFIRGFGIH